MIAKVVEPADAVDDLPDDQQTPLLPHHMQCSLHGAVLGVRLDEGLPPPMI
jgi:hypothetical protein